MSPTILIVLRRYRKQAMEGELDEKLMWKNQPVSISISACYSIEDIFFALFMNTFKKRNDQNDKNNLHGQDKNDLIMTFLPLPVFQLCLITNRSYADDRGVCSSLHQ